MGSLFRISLAREIATSSPSQASWFEGGTRWAVRCRALCAASTARAALERWSPWAWVLWAHERRNYLWCARAHFRSPPHLRRRPLLCTRLTRCWCCLVVVVAVVGLVIDHLFYVSLLIKLLNSLTTIGVFYSLLTILSWISSHIFTV